MIDLAELNSYRTADPRTLWRGDSRHGAFLIPCPTTSRTLKVVCSSNYGWDHVSVSVKGRLTPPAWPEMEFVRRMFFRPDEAVMQYHAPAADYVNGENGSGHPGCLHLWRPSHPLRGEIPTPPKWMVGGMTMDEADAALLEEERAGWTADGGAPNTCRLCGNEFKGNECSICGKRGTGEKA